MPQPVQSQKIYQFKITLKDITPPVWRRIEVPEGYTFWDLHIAIQDAFGWSESHLHEFVFGDPRRGNDHRIGMPMPEDSGENEVIEEWKKRIAAWFTEERAKAIYTYDFGDNWNHVVELEKVIPREKGMKYPRCVDGERACPPEDCGGPWGYEDFLIAIRDPKHPEHEGMLAWAGGNFDPERFDAKKVKSTNPKERLAHMQEMRELMNFEISAF